jgi:hypothetical protein
MAPSAGDLSIARKKSIGRGGQLMLGIALDHRRRREEL